MRERANLDAFRPTMFMAPAPARSSSVRGASFRSMSKIRGAMGYALSMRQLCSPENRRTDDYLLHPLRDRSVPARKLQRVRRELGPHHPSMRRSSGGGISYLTKERTRLRGV